MSQNVDVLNVDLGERSYPIYVGLNLISDAEYFAKHIRSKRVMIVSNTTVAPLYESSLRQALAGFDVDSVILPDGEQYKTWESLNLIFDALLDCSCCTLIACLFCLLVIVSLICLYHTLISLLSVLSCFCFLLLLASVSYFFDDFCFFLFDSCCFLIP